MRRPAAIAALLFAVTSCDGTSATEIVVVVDTDMDELDTFEVTVLAPAAGGSSSADLDAQAAPRTLVLVQADESVESVHLRVAGLTDGTERIVVERVARFEPGESLTLTVFLAAACVDAGCAAPETCGNDGACRDASVAPCEYAGRTCDADAGVDGGPPVDDDAGECALAAETICGVADTHLPGDRVEPVACGGSSGAVTVSNTTAELVPTAGQYLLESGEYTVRIGDDACHVERTIAVATVELAAGGSVTSGQLRDMDARVGMAFVAGQDGAWAVDATRWVDLRASTSGPAAPADLRAVVVAGGQPVFGPNTNVGAVFTVQVDDALTEPFAHDRIDIAFAGDARVRDMAAPLGGSERFVIAAQGGPVYVNPARPFGSPADEGDYDGEWTTIGTRDDGWLGEVWMGRTGEILNLRLGAGLGWEGGAPQGTPEDLVDVRGAVLDDRDESAPRLWLCGSGGVGLIRLDRHDWRSIDSFPDPPDAWWSGPCEHLSIGPDGDVFVATGGSEIVRLAPDAAEILRYGDAQGVSSGASFTRVAVAWDGVRRELWALDPTGDPEVIRFAADAYAP